MPNRRLWTNGLVVQVLAGAVDLLGMRLVRMVKFQPFVLAKHMFAGFSIVAFCRKVRLTGGVPAPRFGQISAAKMPVLVVSNSRHNSHLRCLACFILRHISDFQHYTNNGG
ncbi:hypothetical protein [Rhizobium leguminosarum]|uniref:hypothetical protein n=1 Tax=Rhizobium leguminosarum TaxID=384 RepID=UPI001FDAA8D0|nr:hypothetical protein [Rhizobium leguminosarum]